MTANDAPAFLGRHRLLDDDALFSVRVLVPSDSTFLRDNGFEQVSP